jgi:ferredoxin-like protein FixX
MSGVRCYRNGKKVSEAIDRYFSSGEALPGYRPFNSTLGRVNDEEWNEWLKECSPGASRHEEPLNINEAESEAGNCMHCDCRAAGNCDLRNLSESLNINNPKLKLIGPAAEKKINANNGLVFENAKCIKCGLCVRLGSKQANVPSLCFKGRGFESLISEPLYYDFNDIASGMARDLTDICPTGALSLIDL